MLSFELYKRWQVMTTWGTSLQTAAFRAAWELSVSVHVPRQQHLILFAVPLLSRSTIPDWGHLLFSEDEFVQALEQTSLQECAGLSRHIADYVYR